MKVNTEFKTQNGMHFLPVFMIYKSKIWTVHNISFTFLFLMFVASIDLEWKRRI
jgi:hypothetical protein